MPAQDHTVELIPLAPDPQGLAAAAHVYSGTWRRNEADAYAFIHSQSQYPGFRGLLAVDGGDPVGMAFGTHSLPGQWWHDHVAARVGADHPALTNAWVLTELCVLSPWRQFGIGGRLHDALLAQQPCNRVLLSTEVSNARARSMYERRGWQYLHRGMVFSPGDVPFVIMHREVHSG